jgi:hypothetical protein
MENGINGFKQQSMKLHMFWDSHQVYSLSILTQIQIKNWVNEICSNLWWKRLDYLTLSC